MRRLYRALSNMIVFLRFLTDNAIYLYGLCGLLALYYLRVALHARRERRSSLFPLEREVALGRIYRTFGVALVLLALIGGTWAATERLLPRLEQGDSVGTATPDILVLIDTPTPTTAPPTATPTLTPTPPPRPTRRPPTPTPSEATPAPAIRPPLCPHPGAAIANPGNGQVITGSVAVTGSASIDRFQFYKLEWNSTANPQVWNYFAGGDRPVVGGVLGSFDAAGLASGAYTIRLVVVDNTGNYPEPCTVQVIVP